MKAICPMCWGMAVSWNYKTEKETTCSHCNGTGMVDVKKKGIDDIKVEEGPPRQEKGVNE